MFTRSVVLRRRVEDLQLGVESYQKKLILIGPDTYRLDLKRKTLQSQRMGIKQENGTSVTKMYVPVTAEEKTNKKNDVKVRSLLLMALPNEHQLTFSQYPGAKTMFVAIETRFRGLQKIVSRLAILGVVIAQEDLNSKILSSLPPEWNTYVVVWMNKPEVDTISIDDLYNNFKIVTTKVSTASPNVNTASPQVSTTSFSDNDVYAFMVENPNGSNLLHQDLEQIHEDDLEAMDLKWQLSLLSMRAKRWDTLPGSVEQKEARKVSSGNQRPTQGSKETMKNLLKGHVGTRWSTLEEQLITYRKNEVLFSEEVAVLKREVACKDYEINVLKSEFEKVKQEKEGIEFKIEKFDKASKDLDQLLGSQITDKNDSKKSSDDSLVKEQVSKDTSSFVESSLNVDKETIFPVDKKVESVKPKNHEKPVKISVRFTHKVNTDKTQAVNTATLQAVNTARSKTVKTARPNSAVVNVVRVNQANAVKASSCWFGYLPNLIGKPQQDDTGIVDSGYSRHMTGNIAYLSDFKEFDGGYVTFGGGAHGGRISGKGTLKTDSLDFEDILLKIPRKDNMYNFDMKNIVPKESLTCLVAKATLDESMLWHRRLGHINFKNINKLVKDNLVRGLPTKRFENDQTCVACLKGKQHRASCKSKVLNPITKPLFMLHMDLFGPTFVSSLMHKKYCLVVTDDYSRFTWVFFLTTKDETSEILKNFIKEIENLVDKKVKIIRSDNGTEFKNKVMDDFCREKGIKREYSVARTPQQNGVAERRNRTLIEAARTMLADSKLPTTFWAEAVSTACYVQNRVLVVKPHNKTPYELFRGFKPALSFMRPFGCHVTILNTLDSLGKFDGKSDEGFFVGYSLSSKAFRVYNTRTRRVEENLHIGFLENKPMIEGNGPKWLFDIDSLTQSMNYVPVTAGTISNESAGTQGELNAGTSEEISQDCIVMPIWKDASYFDSPTQDVENGEPKSVADDQKQDGDDPDNEKDEQDKSDDVSSPKEVNVDGQHVNTTSPDVNTGSSKLNTVDPSVNIASSYYQDNLKDMFTMEASHTLEATHVEFFSDEDEPEVDLGNIANSYTVPTTPNTRIHKDHPIENVIGDVKPSVQTRKMTKPTSEQGFLSVIEPISIAKALSDSSWVEAMQEYFCNSNSNRQEAPVARIEAIRLFLAYASFMGILVYQMDIKSAFLYETIEEEVYVTQPPGFKDPDHPNKVYKVVKALYGLHQSPRAWYETLANYLLGNGFKRGTIDQTLFIKKQKGDILLVQIRSYKKDAIIISQDKYVAEILKKFNYTDVKYASTPVDLEKPLVKDGDADDVDYVHVPDSKLLQRRHIS
ncbi:putative ribonuclease H-like domain-containing protein [Tanacetum coccineum]